MDSDLCVVFLCNLNPKHTYAAQPREIVTGIGKKVSLFL